MGSSTPLLSGPKRGALPLHLAGASVLALCLVVGFTGVRHKVALEEAGNPNLSDDAASKELDDYFAGAGLGAKAAVRKSDSEARDSMNAFVLSLNDEASLGKRFCDKHPQRCGKAAKELAAAKSKEHQNDLRSKLLSTGRAPSSSGIPAAAPSSPARDARLGDDIVDFGATKAADDGDVHVDSNEVRQYMFMANAKKHQHDLRSKLLSTGRAPSASGISAAAPSSPARDSRLGDDIVDFGATKAADDGDVHVDSNEVRQYMFMANAKKPLWPDEVRQYMFSKDGAASNAWLKSDSQVLKTTQAPSLKLNVKAKLAAHRLPNLSAADDATLEKCNVPPPRPAYCRLLLDVVMQVDSVKTGMPERNETVYTYTANTYGHTLPLHGLVPLRMKHKDGSDLGGNVVQFGIPDTLTSADEQHEEGNLIPSPYGKEKGGPMSPLLREGATRTQNPHWATKGLHYPFYHAKIKSLDRATSDQVLYGAINDYKKLGLALADDYVSPTADAEEREKEMGTQPRYFEERFHPLGKFASNKEWKDEVDPTGFSADDADALVKAEGNSTDEYGGRSAVEQHLLYGQDFFNLGHAVDEATDNGGVLNDVRYMGPGDGHPMPAFPRDTNAMERHPWTDQGHVFYDEVGLPVGGIADTGRSNYTV